MQPITLRDLRHCYATYSAQGTGDAAATQAALGHTELATTQRYLTATLSRTAGESVAVANAMGLQVPPPERPHQNKT
jgi:integrase